MRGMVIWMVSYERGRDNGKRASVWLGKRGGERED